MVTIAAKSPTLVHGRCSGCNKTAWTNWANRLTPLHPKPGYYCDECYERFSLKDRPPAAAGKAATKDDTNPWQENMIRAMEGD